MAAHIVHAAGESGPAPAGSIAVALTVVDEDELLALSMRLDTLGVEHVLIRENAGPYDGQAMAIGAKPVTDRKSIRKATSHLPLVR